MECGAVVTGVCAARRLPGAYDSAVGGLSRYSSRRLVALLLYPALHHFAALVVYPALHHTFPHHVLLSHAMSYSRIKWIGVDCDYRER